MKLHKSLKTVFKKLWIMLQDKYLERKQNRRQMLLLLCYEGDEGGGTKYLVTLTILMGFIILGGCVMEDLDIR